MITSKMVTNIYYGSTAHLRICLDRLVENGALSWWVFCEHKGERQFNSVLDVWEGDRQKRHVHVGLKPNKRLNLDVVYGECLEMVDSKLTGFTRNWEFVRSMMDFWLYLFHDKAYLEEKQLVREFNYTESDLVCSDDNIKDYELFKARQDFWSQVGIKKEALKVVKGSMSEAVYFAHNIKNAYGADKLLKATRREVFREVNKEDDYFRRCSFRQIGLL